MNNERPLILLFGHNGQLAWELRRSLPPLADVVTAGMDGADHYLDLTDSKALGSLVRELMPDLMVNAVAYTAVDKAESEPELAYRVNAAAVGEIGRLGAVIHCPVLHYSTDYVFSGKGAAPWKEKDATAPQSVYGQTKLAGEQELLSSKAECLILRTAWVYGGRGRNFLLTMQKLFHEKEQLKVVADQLGAPTWSRMIAEATAQLLAQCRTVGGGFSFGNRRSEIFHLTAAGQASWYEFAQAILDAGDDTCELEPVSTADYPTEASRPAYSVLDNERLWQAWRISLPHWKQGLALCLEEMRDK
ncbi:MAG TPA: dTDP-4-dehydrorhamnose reductase [Thiolapillus brandeum]|uniref:dTDP-4-dehydrorhamnose reductase n=1 Tax=Thiolapillus brandeum TaxID=1076588 RepID=A0A831NZI9_9GAMM|nr:dTDP-4-dehydrorhamnose reductase [Thiolapillus brandeum]